MKKRLTIISASGFLGGVAVITFSQALAIEPPPDNAEPPAALMGGAENPPPAPRPLDKLELNLPFIGLATATVPEMVADHLDLKRGSGVIVRTVYPDSPANKAGLSVNDIILSVGETLIGNPEELSSSIQSMRPGDRIAVSLIHKGLPKEVEVTLGERPAGMMGGIAQDPMLEGIPQPHADRLRGLLRGSPGGIHDRSHSFPDAQLENSLRMMREQMNRAMGGDILEVPDGNRGGGIVQNRSTIRMTDSQGSIEIMSSLGETEVTVRNERNETVWSGPWNNETDRSAAPKEIRERIEKVKPGSGSGFSFRFGKPKGAEPRTLDN